MSRALIDELVEGLEPSRRPPSMVASLALWSVASWASVAILIALTGSLRGDALTQLAETPRFLLECALGIGVGIVAMAGALRIATPGYGDSRRLVLPGLALLVCWVAAYAYGLVDPALAPSMEGYRSHCFAQILLFSIPPLLLGMLLLRGRAALEPGPAAGLAGLAAASLPGLAMQLACMYDPLHALQLHLPPLLVLGGIGALLGAAALRRI